MECGEEYSLDWLMKTEGIPRCGCGGIVRPDITLYGEAPNKYVMMGAHREISHSDTLIVAGTSLTVEPAASCLDYFHGRDLVIINKTPTPADARATLVLREDIAKVMGEIEIG